MRADSSRSDNPVRRIRQALGLTQNQLALICGCSAVKVYEIERGAPALLLPAIRAGLESLGIDSDKVSVDYAAWRQLQSIRLIQEVREREEYRKACGGEDFRA